MLLWDKYGWIGNPRFEKIGSELWELQSKENIFVNETSTFHPQLTDFLPHKGLIILKKWKLGIP